MGLSLLPPFLATLFLAVSSISSENLPETLRPVSQDVSPLPSADAKNSSVAQDTSVQQQLMQFGSKDASPKVDQDSSRHL